MVAPERTIVMPCLHDEGYARLRIIARSLSQVARAWYLSGPEQELARELGLDPGAGELTGAGVPVPERYDPEAFRARHSIERRSEEHTSELQSLMRISSAVFCLKKKKT